MIKFRGKRIDNGEWVKGQYCQYQGDILVDGSFHAIAHEVHPDSVAQFTNKFDKNDKEIYGSVEIDGKMTKGGDRVRYNNHIFNIEFHEGYFRGIQEGEIEPPLILSITANLFGYSETIGNQYEDK